MDLEYLKPTNFSQFWTIVDTSVAALGILLILAQLIYLTIQLRRARNQVRMLQASETTKIFFEVMTRWSDVYPARNRLLAKPPAAPGELLKKYNGNPSELLNSDEWINDYRPLLNFFEFLGVLLTNDVFDQEAITSRIFTLVTVDTFSAPDDASEQELINSGSIYLHLKPYLDFLRVETAYRSDIYENYDDELLTRYAQYMRAKNASVTDRARKWFGLRSG